MNSMKKYSSKFVGRIVKDFRHKELFPLKILFFIHASTLYVLYPYLTIHMRELGINVEETAIMSAVTPVIAIIMPPLAGMVADKIGNFKILLSFFSTIGGLAALSLLLVPVGRLTVTYPENVMFSVGCNHDLNGTRDELNYLQLHLSEDIPCNRTGITVNNFPTTLQTCGFLCESQSSLKDVPEFFQPSSTEEENGELSVDPILKARSYIVSVTDSITKESIIHKYNLTQEETSRKQTKEEAISDRFMKHNENYQTAIRRMSASQYFLPTLGVNHLNCIPYEEENNRPSSLARMSRFRRSPSQYTCHINSEHEENSLTINNGVSFQSILNPTSTKHSFKISELSINDTIIEPFCLKEEKWNKTSAKVFLHDPEDNEKVVHELNLKQCRQTCLLTAERKNVCSNLQKELTYDPAFTFWLYLAIRVLVGIIGGTTFAMFEGAIIAVLREQNADYGLQRIYASIGGMISSPLSGILIDYASQGKGYTDFRPAFYLYAVLKVIGGILMLTINLEFKVGAENVISDVIAVLKRIEIITLLIASFILGTSWGYIESFLFWLLQDLGGTRSLMGITITVGGIAGIPLLAMSGPIIKRIGHANVLFIGFIFYAVRLTGYSIIYNPWHCLYFEAMESVTTSLAFTAAVTYAAKLSTPTTDSSIQGLLGGLYFGVGKGAGSLAGGYLMKALGTRYTFRIFAVFTAIMGVAYYLFNRFYIVTHPSPDIPENVDPDKKEKCIGLEIISEKPKTGNDKVILNNNINLAEEKTGSHENPAFDSDKNDKTEDKNEENNKSS